MITNGSLLAPLPVALPLSVAALLAGGNKFVPRWFADALSIVTAIATGGACVALWRAAGAAPVVYWFGGWTPRAGVALGVSFYIGPLNAALATFTCLLMLAALVLDRKSVV